MDSRLALQNLDGPTCVLRLKDDESLSCELVGYVHADEDFVLDDKHGDLVIHTLTQVVRRVTQLGGVRNDPVEKAINTIGCSLR